MPCHLYHRRINILICTEPVYISDGPGVGEDSGSRMLSGVAVSHKPARMSHVCSLPLLVACALLAVAVDAAPALPKRSETKGTKMVPDRSIMVKRLPYAYYYPSNLWPRPKFPPDDIEISYETFQFRKTIEHMIEVG